MRSKTAPVINPGISLGEDFDSLPFRKEQMAVALAARARGIDVPEPARGYAKHSFVDLAHEILVFHRLAYGLDARVDGPKVIELALTTSDFPNLLANAANKVLMPAYDAAAPTYRLLAERMDLPDFKTASVLKVGDFPIPKIVGESGEITLGAFSEAKDVYALATYGRRILFSFQALVNDDLAAFVRLMNAVAVRLADFENGLWFTLLTSGSSNNGPTLGDAAQLFATAHGNLAGSGTAIAVDSLGAGRAAIRKQTGLDGVKLNLVPRYLLTSPDKETLARQYTMVTDGAVVPASKNPWAGTLEPIADANLSSANFWYMFADPARAATSVYGYLRGQPGPSVKSREGFEVLGVEMRVALHFGTAFVDFRGAYRNPGA
jgi:hypothetical protein